MAPRSPLNTMSMVLNLAEMIRPESILDVGAGFGGAGFLIRQYLDLRTDRKKGFADWSIRIDGIEIFEKYITPVHAYISTTTSSSETRSISCVKKTFTMT